MYKRKITSCLTAPRDSVLFQPVILLSVKHHKHRILIGCLVLPYSVVYQRRASPAHRASSDRVSACPITVTGRADNLPHVECDQLLSRCHVLAARYGVLHVLAFYQLVNHSASHSAPYIAARLNYRYVRKFILSAPSFTTSMLYTTLS